MTAKRSRSHKPVSGGRVTPKGTKPPVPHSIPQLPALANDDDSSEKATRPKPPTRPGKLERKTLGHPTAFKPGSRGNR